MRAAAAYGVTRADVCYCCMPLFHGNALMACWAPALAVGATVALRRKFSASGFLPDIRRHGCTYFTYVGRTIAYILATEPTADDRDHVAAPGLRYRGVGARPRALCRPASAARWWRGTARANQRCRSCAHPTRRRTRWAGHASTTVPTSRSSTLPPASSALARASTNTARSANGHDAIGELVNRRGVGSFEGYFANDEATTERLRNGWYWTGDLAYRDADGFFYFAGRTADWLRVDGENFSTAPVEAILHRFVGCVMVAAYAVPDPRTGDQVMAAIEMAPGHEFDPAEFVEFLAAQRDLGTKWTPRFVRVIDAMPLTANNKVNKQPLRAEAWRCTDPVWWRPAGDATYRLMTAGDRATLDAELAQHVR